MSLIVKKFMKDIPAVIGLVIICFSLFLFVFGEWLAPYPLDAYESHIDMRLQPPSAEHWFGTDDLGRDILSRVILGTRISLTVSMVVVFSSMLIGVPLGLIAGYYSGWLSEAIMRVTDVFLAVPQLILALAVAQLFSPSIESAMVALTLTYWPFFTRIVYAETRRIKVSLFVDALQCLGAKSWRIIFIHILPNTASPIIVRATIGMGFTILVTAVLGFLGMGATPPQPDWGLAIAESRRYLPEAWWFSTFPGLAIFIVVFGFNLLGDGLRDIVDPRLRRSR